LNKIEKEGWKDKKNKKMEANQAQKDLE